MRKTIANSFRPTVETLEGRSLTAVSVFASPGGVLNVVGDGANDYAAIYDDGGSGITVKTDNNTYSFAGINSIVVDMGAGNDTVVYNLLGDLQPGVTRKVDVALRQGDDSFFASLYNPSTQTYSNFRQGSLLLMSVKGHEGNDSLLFDASGGVDMDHATMKIGFYGNEGDDRIGMTYAGLNDHGGVSFFGYGGDGNDLIRMSLWADPHSVAPSPGGFRAQAFGEAGDDSILLLIDAPKAVDTWSSLIDGGDGKNDFAWTNLDPGQVTDCETIVFI